MKLSQLQSYLRKQKINLAFLAAPDPNITYFTQMKPSAAHLLITPKKATLYLSKLDKKPKIKDITIKFFKKDKERKQKFNKIGINKNSLTVSQLEKLRKTFKGAKFVDLSKKLNQLRAQKTTKEIKKISQACQITTAALKSLLKELPKRTLKTEQDVAFFLEKKFKDQGAELAFPSIVANGKNAAVPHHITSTQRLRRGFLLIDCGACYEHYCSDMSRVLFLGKPNKEEQKFYQLLLKAQEEAINKIKSKVAYCDLDKTARDSLGKYSSYFIHALGHGLGIEIHEAPNSKDETSKIEKNQVFTIEPGIYFPNKFGLRIEDTVLFDGRTKILTKFPKKLMSVNF